MDRFWKEVLENLIWIILFVLAIIFIPLLFMEFDLWLFFAITIVAIIFGFGGSWFFITALIEKWTLKQTFLLTFIIWWVSYLLI